MTPWDDFDRELVESLETLSPPDGALRAVTPWRTAMNRIVAGLCLTCFTLDFCCLQYLLPAIGAVQLYLGFRTLRNNNRWFQFGWICSICKVILLSIALILEATPYAGVLSAFRAVLQAGATLALFAALRQALHQAAGDLGERMAHDPVLWAVLWYLLVIVLALVWPQPGWLVGLAMLLAFAGILVFLLRAAAELDSWGYAVQAAPVKVSAGQVQGLFYGFLLALIVICGLFSNHIRVDGTVIEQNFDSAEMATVQNHLLDLGFPREMLDYLPSEELEILADASACDFRPNEQSAQLDGQPLTLSGAMVYLGNGTARFYVLAEYDDGANLFWQNMAQFANSSITRWDGACYLTYRKNGIDYRAAVPVQEQVETVDTFFSGLSEENQIRAWYSFPARSTARTCLFACTVKLWEPSGDWYPGYAYYYQDTIVNFHWRGIGFQYPYAPLMDGFSSLSYLSMPQYCSVFEFLIPETP